MSTPSIAKSRTLKTAASKKRSVKSSATARRKVTSAATAAKVPPISDEPKVERVTKQERLLTLLSQAEPRGRDDPGNRLAAAQRARVIGGHGEEEAWFLADHFESGRRRPPLPHRDASRSLTWPSRRLIIAESLPRLSAATIFELRASGGGCIGHRRQCGCLVIS